MSNATTSTLEPRRDREDSTSLYDPKALAAVIRLRTDAEADEVVPVFLCVRHAHNEGALTSIPQGTLLIGRAIDADARVDHPSVSRHHAELRREGDQFFLRDLGSQNGTSLNGSRLKKREVEIFPGDHIALGDAVLELRGPRKTGTQVGLSPRPRSKARILFAGVAGFATAALALWMVTGLELDARPPPKAQPIATAPVISVTSSTAQVHREEPAAVAEAAKSQAERPAEEEVVPQAVKPVTQAKLKAENAALAAKHRRSASSRARGTGRTVHLQRGGRADKAATLTVRYRTPTARAIEQAWRSE